MGVLLSCGMLVFFGGGCIFDPGGSFKVSGKVTLDGEPAVGWAVWANNQAIPRTQITDSNGHYHLTGKNCEGRFLNAAPPQGLGNSVTPSLIQETGLCERNVIDFSFSSSSPP
jgi:hypothetical protein